MQQAIEDYLGLLTANRGFSDNTVAAYRNDLTQFERFLLTTDARGLAKTASSSAAGSIINWPEVTRVQVLAFVLFLKDKRYATSTVARKVAAVKSFFHYLVAEGIIKTDPTENLDSPKVGKTLPRTLTVEEVDRLLEMPLRSTTPEGIRDSAMLQLLYATGMRVSEMIALNVDDINCSAGYVRCVGKSGKERIIPVRAESAQVVENYLENGRPHLVKTRDERALFVNHRGDRLTRQGFWLIVKTYARAIGTETNITPHTLRHSFAAHQLSSGARLEDVRQLLGHASISTTQIYTQLAGLQRQKPMDEAATVPN